MADTGVMPPAPPVLKPVSKIDIGDAVGGVFRLVLSNLRTLVLLSLLFGLLGGLCGIALFLLPISLEELAAGIDPDDPPVAEIVSIAIAAFVLFLVLFVWFQNAVLHSLLDLGDSGRVTVVQSIKLGRTGIPGMTAVMILYYGGIVLGGMLLYVPGVLFAVMFFVVRSVKLAEGCGILEAFGIARSLTRGSRWSILGVWVLVWLIGSVCAVVLQVAVIALKAFILFVLPETLAIIIVFLSPLILIFLQLFVFYIFAAAEVVIYRMLTRPDSALSPRQTAAVFD